MASLIHVKEYHFPYFKSTADIHFVRQMKTRFNHTICMIGVVQMVDFGDRLKELRKRSKLSQEQLAQQLGITKGMISSYETSMRMPSYQVLLKIALLFNVSTDYLLGKSKNDMINISDLSEAQKALICEIINQFRIGNK